MPQPYGAYYLSELVCMCELYQYYIVMVNLLQTRTACYQNVHASY